MLSSSLQKLRNSLIRFMKPLSGVFSVWKPSGVLSNDVISYVKRIILNWQQQEQYRAGKIKNQPDVIPSPDEFIKSLQVDGEDKYKRKFMRFPKEIKCGHGGTLDPLAEGILVVAIGKGTKLLSHFLGAESCRKTYMVTAVFGKETDSYDITGTVTGTAEWSHVTKEAIEMTLSEKFTGKIKQLPPSFSALKINGERMYDLARKALKEGTEFKVPEGKIREVAIDNIELLSFEKPISDDQPPTLKLKMTCSGGTYVRSIVHDLAKELHSAACMTTLVRSGQGIFSENANDTNYRPLQMNELCDFDKISERLIESIDSPSPKVEALVASKRTLIDTEEAIKKVKCAAN